MAEKILIVDDDVETVRLVGLMLQRQNFEVIAANSGEQALELAKVELPDLIVLDIMMPEMDGYAVARQLRNTIETAEIPILMFTAKGQVEDKVAGFESGADDYLTKPVHPAELVAHIRSLLSRRQHLPSQAKNTGFVLGMISPKGGMGVSSTALALAIAVHEKTQNPVIAAELKPGMGSWQVSLGLKPSNGLGELLRKPAGTIVRNDVENQLVKTMYGVRLLLASNDLADVDLFKCSDNFIGIVTHLSRLAPFVILDIGTPTIPCFRRLAHVCDELLVISEAQPESLKRTCILLEQLPGLTANQKTEINVAIVNRQRADFQLKIDEVTDTLGITPVSVIPPGPELAFQAAQKQQPISFIQPQGIVTQQLEKLASHYAKAIEK